MDFGALGFLPGFPEGRSPLLHDQDPQLPPGEDDPDPSPPDHLHGVLSGATERSGDDSGGRGDTEELKDPLLSAAAELLEEGAVGELGDVPPCRIFDATRIWRLALYPADGSVPASTAAFYSDSPRDDSQSTSSPAAQPEESSSPETDVPERDTLTSQTPSNGQDEDLGEGGAGEVYKGNGGAEKFRGSRAKEQSQATQACGQCGKMFRSSSALNKHFLSHSQERRHVCCVCQKAFKRQDHLASHMVTHQKSKPFGCCVINCGKSYCDLRSLRRHYEAHHKHMALGEEGRGTAGISSEVIDAVMTPELVQQMLPPVLELISPLAQPAPPTSPVQNAGSTGAAIVTVLHTASQSNLQEGAQNEATPGKASGEAIGHLTVVSRGNDARPPLTPDITVLHTQEPTRPASWPHPNPAPGTSPHLPLPPTTESLVPEVKGQQKLDSFVQAFARRRPSLLAALEARGFVAGEVRTEEPLQQQQQQQEQFPPYRAHASVSVAKLSPCSVPPQPPPLHQFSGPVFEGGSYSMAYQQEQSLLPDNCTTSSPSSLVSTPRGWQRPALQATLQALQQHLQPRQTWRPAWGQYHPSGSSTLSFSQDFQNSGVPYVPQAPASPLNQAATSPLILQTSPLHPRSLPAHPLTPTSPAPTCQVPPSPTHSRPTQPLPPPSLLTPLSTPPLTSSASSCLDPAWGVTQALGQLSQMYPNACRTVMSGNGCASSPRQFAHFSPADMVQHTGVVLHCSPHNSAEGLGMAQHALVVNAGAVVPQCVEEHQGVMAPYGKTSQPITIQQSTTQPGSAQPETGVDQYVEGHVVITQPSVMYNPVILKKAPSLQPLCNESTLDGSDTLNTAQLPVSAKCTVVASLQHTASISTPSTNEQQQGHWEPVGIKEVSQASREAAPRPGNVQVQPYQSQELQTDSGASQPAASPRLTCSLCCRTFRSLPALNGHMRLHSARLRPDRLQSENLKPQLCELLTVPISSSAPNGGQALGSIAIKPEPGSPSPSPPPCETASLSPAMKAGDKMRPWLLTSENNNNSTSHTNLSLNCQSFNPVSNKMPATPTKRKQRPRPEPLVLPPLSTSFRAAGPPTPQVATLFQSHLRSPNMLELAEGLPYTPPPMLSPIRHGSGLYFSALMSGTPSNLTAPKPPPTPRILFGRLYNLDLDNANTFPALPEEASLGIEPHINVGSRFQAEIPTLCEREQTARDLHAADLVWQPWASLHEDASVQQQVEAFLNVASCSVMPGGGTNRELALHCLHKAVGNMLEALEILLLHGVERTPEHPLYSYHYAGSDSWSPDERRLFLASMAEHDKDFFLVQKVVGSKTVAQCVEFYYTCKKLLRLDGRHGTRLATAEQGLMKVDGEQHGAGGDLKVAGSAPSGEPRIGISEGASFHCQAQGCSACFLSRQALNGHARAHAAPRLGSRSLARPRPRPVSSHRRPVLGLMPSPQPSEESSEAFPCKQCAKVFFKVKSRNAHMKTHRQQEEQLRQATLASSTSFASYPHLPASSSPSFFPTLTSSSSPHPPFCPISSTHITHTPSSTYPQSHPPLLSPLAAHPPTSSSSMSLPPTFSPTLPHPPTSSPTLPHPTVSPSLPHRQTSLPTFPHDMHCPTSPAKCHSHASEISHIHLPTSPPPYTSNPHVLESFDTVTLTTFTGPPYIQQVEPDTLPQNTLTYSTTIVQATQFPHPPLTSPALPLSPATTSPPTPSDAMTPQPAPPTTWSPVVLQKPSTPLPVSSETIVITTGRIAEAV